MTYRLSRIRTRSLPALALLLLAACASPESQSQTQMQAARAWAAAAQLVMEQWLEGTVPAHYARRSLQQAGLALLTLASQVESSGDTGLKTVRALARIAVLGRAVEAARGALDSPLRADAERQAERLRTLLKEAGGPAGASSP